MRSLRRILILTLLMLAGAAGAYVQSEGFSGRWRQFVEEQFEQRGLFLSLEKLTLSPVEGLVARNIRIFQDAGRKVLLADVDRLHLDLDYSQALREQILIEGVDLRDADLSFPMDPEDPASEKLALKDLNARLYMAGDRMEIRRAQGTLFGLRIHITGTLLRAEREERPKDEALAAERRRQRIAELRKRRDLIIEAARVLRHFESAEAPRLDIEINGDLEKPSELNASLHLTARNLRHGTYLCEEIDAQATYVGEQVDLSRLRLKDHLGTLEAGAAWHLGGGEVDFHVRSSVDLPGLAAAAFQKEMFREVVFYEPVEVQAEGKWLVGKTVPPDAFLPVSCVGSVRAGRMVTRGEVMDGLEGSFGLSPEGCYFRDVLLRHESGTLGLQAMWRPKEGFRYRALVQLDPRIIIPFIDFRPTQEILSRFSFDESSGIYAEFEGEGPEPRLDRCRSTGRAELQRFSFRGTAFDRVKADLEFGGRRHAYRNVEAERSEGRASVAEVVCNDEERSVKITGLVADLDPVAVTGCFAPKTAEVIAKYRFDKHPHTELDGIIFPKGGPTGLKVSFRSAGTAHYVLLGKDHTIHQPVCHLHFDGPQLNYDVKGSLYGGSMNCTGSVDLRPDAKTYSITFRAGRFPQEIFGKPLPFENVSTTVTNRAGTVDFNVQSDLLEGRFRLDGRFDDTRENKPYSGEIQINAVSFSRFASVYSPGNTTEGDFTGHFKFSGRLGDWRALRGSGALTILNSNLYAVPILGPLTPLIGAVLPRPIKGYNQAKEADCTFTVADGFVSTDNVEALTGVFRLEAKGKVDFLEDRIQFEAKAKVRGLPGLVFLPVSEILEYVGEGSVGNAMWRPRYFSGSKEKNEFRKPGEPIEAQPVDNNPSMEKPSRPTRPVTPVRK